MADRLVFLHGFTQTHHHWHDVAHRLAARLDGEPSLAFVDLPGHGLSDDDRTPITEAGDALASLGGSGDWVGYSMGGRFALHAALAAPEKVERLVLIGATPGIAEPTERAERRRLDDERAEGVELIGVEAFLNEWLAAPLFATLPPDRRGLEHRRRNGVAGLAASLRTAGTGVQEPLWARLDELAMPVLVLAGELDEKFTAIGRRMADALPHGTFASIAGAGHAAHAEQPDAAATTIADWLG